ncbi:MAG: type I-E CRISPR-associated protein Cse2/CasB [Methylococcaceae bacterium]|nr:type I-E CRISPR-associated protein Cse2/CasB [Methylococcaceae bacterium]
MKIQLQTLSEGKGILIPEDFLKECGFTEAVNCRLDKGRIIIEPLKFQKDRTADFVNYIFNFCKQGNKAALSALKGTASEHPQKQRKSFHYLASFYIDFDSPNAWLPYATIATAIAKAEAKENGVVGIGRALARCYGLSEKGDNKEIETQAVKKLHRLLACDSTSEVCRVLRPLFSLIEAKGLAQTIDYISLLRELEGFNVDWSREKSKEYWTRDFYKRLQDKDDKENEK